MRALITLVGTIGVVSFAVLLAFKLAGHLPDRSWLFVATPLVADVLLVVGLLIVGSFLEGSARSVADVASFLGRGRRMQRVVDQGVEPPKLSAPSDSAVWWAVHHRRHTPIP